MSANENMYDELPSTSRSVRKRAAPDSNTSSDEEEIVMNRVYENNKYMLKPNAEDFNLSIVNGFLEEMQSSDKNIVSNIDAFMAQKRTFTKPIKRFQYIQYNYKQTIKFPVYTNAFGICITNAEDFTSKTIMTNLNSLEAKHRVHLLLPTTQHMWYGETSKLFTAIFEAFVDDLRKLVTKKNKEFLENLETHNIKVTDLASLIAKLRIKFITGTTVRQNTVMPSVFGIKLYTSQVPPVTILPPCFLVKENGLQEMKWEYLARPKHIHSMQIIKLSGFKITKTGISLDLTLDCLLFQNMKEQTETGKSVYHCSKFILKKCKNESDSDSEYNKPFVAPF